MQLITGNTNELATTLWEEAESSSLNVLCEDGAGREVLSVTGRSQEEPSPQVWVGLIEFAVLLQYIYVAS